MARAKAVRLAMVIAANVAGWPLLQLGIAWGVTKMNPRRFANDHRFYHVRTSELSLYRNLLHIWRWKRLLPDGGPWVGGGFHKKRLDGFDLASLSRLVVETRRGEVAHWLMLACFPIFFFWNPHWACVVMSAYAMAANLPCIVVQRYNRQIVLRLLLRRAGDPPVAID